MDSYSKAYVPTGSYGSPPIPSDTALKFSDYPSQSDGSMYSQYSHSSDLGGSTGGGSSGSDGGGSGGYSLYVGNISFEATEEDLRRVFSQYGPVNSVSLVVDKQTGKSRGFAFIEMPASAAKDAVSRLDGFEFFGRNIRVNFAKEKGSSSSSSSNPRGSRSGPIYGSFSDRESSYGGMPRSGSREGRSSFREGSPGRSSYPMDGYSRGGGSHYSSSGSSGGYGGGDYGGRGLGGNGGGRRGRGGSRGGRSGGSRMGGSRPGGSGGRSGFGGGGRRSNYDGGSGYSSGGHRN